MKRRVAVTLLLLWAFTLGGCPKGVPGHLAGKLTTPEQYLALQRARSSPDRMRVKGFARVVWKPRGIRVRTGLKLVLSSPDSLRSEVLIAGRPQVQVAMNSHGVDAYLHFMQLFAHGDNPDVLFEQFTHGLLSRDAFLDLLLGRVPDFKGWTGLVAREPESGMVRLELQHPSGAEVVVWLYEQSFEPQRLVGWVPGVEGVAYAVGFDEYQDLNNHRLPHLVSIEIPSQEMMVELEYKDVEADVPVEDGEFTLVAPQGSRVASLEDLLHTALGGGAEQPQ